MNSKVSGFTFIKNGLTLGYPILESVKAIAPLCDEVVINVGFDDPHLKKDDGTYEYLRDHLPENKFRFLKNYWNPALKSGGLILSEQTNLALRETKFNYAQYIQGDECIHEADLPLIEKGILELESRPEIMGLIFNYLHFYGNVDTYKYTRSLYRREVRLIRNHQQIVSWKDAQGFRYTNGQKIKAKRIDARIFHYGWARLESVMKKKVHVFDTFYHGENHGRDNSFKYERNWGVMRFLKTHPSVMMDWIAANRNPVDLMALPLSFDYHNIVGLMLSDYLEKLTDYRIGEYKNYLEVK